MESDQKHLTSLTNILLKSTLSETSLSETSSSESSSSDSDINEIVNMVKHQRI